MFQMLNNAKIEAQVQLQKSIIEERTKKDLAIQQAIAQTRSEMGEKGEGGITVVTLEGWPGQATQAQIPNIMVATEVDDSPEKKIH